MATYGTYFRHQTLEPCRLAPEAEAHLSQQLQDFRQVGCGYTFTHEGGEQEAKKALGDALRVLREPLPAAATPAEVAEVVKSRGPGIISWGPVDLHPANPERAYNWIRGEQRARLATLRGEAEAEPLPSWEEAVPPARLDDLSERLMGLLEEAYGPVRGSGSITVTRLSDGASGSFTFSHSSPADNR